MKLLEKCIVQLIEQCPTLAILKAVVCSEPIPLVIPPLDPEQIIGFPKYIVEVIPVQLL